MGTGGNFDETLEVVHDAALGHQVVKARGPLKKSVTRVIELCVWVFQRAEDPREQDDAIANAMGPGKGTEMHEKGCTDMADTYDLGTDIAHWEMDLDDRDETENTNFVTGSATAVAIGAFYDDSLGDEMRRAFVWSEPVWLEVQQDDAPPA